MPKRMAEGVTALTMVLLLHRSPRHPAKMGHPARLATRAEQQQRAWQPLVNWAGENNYGRLRVSLPASLHNTATPKPA
jgi:hypothetical protein